MDALQLDVLRLVERAAERGDSPEQAFAAIRAAARRAAGLPEESTPPLPLPPEWPVPRLTEPWFC